jgi:hypothetical protein
MKSIIRGNRRHPNRSATITTKTLAGKTVTKTNRAVGTQFQIESEKNGGTVFTIELANGTRVFLSGYDVRGIRALFDRHEAAKGGVDTGTARSHETASYDPFSYYG